MTAKTQYSNQDLQLYIQEYKNGKSLTKISEEYQLNRHVLSRILKENNIVISKRKYQLNELAFNNMTSDAAYWLGFIAADGCITATNNEINPKVLSFNLNVQDKEHLEKFKNFVQSTAIIKEQPGIGYGKNTTIAHLEINSRQLVSDLERYGICKAKSLILKPPNIEKQFYLAWIRGYLDGDGSICLLKNGNIQLTFVGTEEVLRFIESTLTPNKIHVLYKRKINDKNNYQLSLGGTKSILPLLHALYDNATYYLERKYEKVLEVYSRFEK